MVKLEKHPGCKLLSFQEERSLSWLVANPGMSANLPFAFLTETKIDVDKLRLAMKSLGMRHDALRTTFHVLPNGSFVRRVAETPAEIPITVIDRLGAESDDVAVAELTSQFIDTPISPDGESLIRILVINISNGRSVLVFNVAHLITDGGANDVMAGEFWNEYTHCVAGTSAGTVAPLFDLRDLVGSQRDWAGTDDFRTKLSSTAERVTTQAVNLLRLEKQDFMGAELSAQPASTVAYVFDDKSRRALAAFADTNKTTPFVVMFSLSAALLSAIYARRSFFMVFTFSNRFNAIAQRMVGFLSNQVPVYFDIEAGVSFGSLVEDTNRKSWDMMRYGAIPYSELSRVVLGSNKSIRNVLNRYLFTMTYPTDNVFVGANGMTASGYPLARTGFIANDMQLNIREVNRALTLSMRVPAGKKQIAENDYVPLLSTITQAVLAHPDEPIGRLLQRPEVVGVMAGGRAR